MLNNDWLALLITFILAFLWLRLNDYAASRAWIDSHLSRKIIHIGTGPLFVLCWPLFSNSFISPFLAALVPFSFTIQFILIGIGIWQDDQAVIAMTRTGNRTEILQGPVYYGLVFILVTLVFWLRDPIGIIALMLLCGGDGCADIIGRRYGKKTLPWSRNKTWLGSSAMFLGGWIFAILVLLILTHLGSIFGSIENYLLPITLLAFVGTIVESLPIENLDNITVPASVILIGLLIR